MKFTYQGRTFDRYDHLYNSTYLNSRGVEIPVASDFLWKNRGRALELGNVLSHYPITLPNRTIVDKYEKAKGVQNADVMSIRGVYDTIVAVSTIEHIGLDFGEEKDLGAALRAVEHLKTLLSQNGKMLVTVPLGWHPTLDPEDFGFTYGSYLYWTMSGDWQLEWHEVHTRADVPVDKLEYGETMPWAGSIWIGELA